MGRKMRSLRLIFFLCAGLLSALPMRAADWQWSVELAANAPGNSSAHPRAFLWVPPDCQRVRAVVVGQNNMIEPGILEHPEFRAALAKLGVAELYIAPGFDNWQDAANNDSANKIFSALLKQLADESGYGELEFAPVIPIGHSAMASFPWNFAAWNPERTLAILSVHGDAPQTDRVGNGRPNVDWGARNIDGIPGLMVVGEYEWWEDRITSAVAFRARHPDAPLALLCDVGHGHFDYSDELVRYLALFIRKAVEQRLPADAPTNQFVKLKPVDARDGWLMDRWHRNEKPRAAAAPFAKYNGDTNEAFWCFDEEMARASENFNPQFGKLPQLVGFEQDGQIMPQTVPPSHEQVRLKTPVLDDTLTFKLHGVFLDTVPPGPRPTMWTGLPVGAALTHASGGGPVVLSRIVGPVIQTAPDTFAVRFNRSSLPMDFRIGDIWLLASHPGDAKYKSAVEQALLKIPVPQTEGAPQRITFPAIADVPVGTKSVALNATADSGAKVYYYVREGPAEIAGDTIQFTKIPPRAKFPVKVTVVAWQWGRTTAPKLQSAAPVAQSFFITKTPAD